MAEATGCGEGESDMEKPTPSTAPNNNTCTSMLMTDGTVDTLKVTGQKVTHLQGGPGQISQTGNDNTVNIYPRNETEGPRNIKPKPPVIDCQEKTGDDAMNIVADHIGKDWRRLGRALGFSNGELDNIQLDYNQIGQREVNYQMLRKWTEQAQQTELERLAEKCVEIGRKDISDKLTNMHDRQSV